ncbi:hypothetical protein AGMMS49921_00060 [Endomicrobiia bacterium]|nr:hypothetical protein AGMMS49921_00060 [Endomicrobiia bacterium]
MKKPFKSIGTTTVECIQSGLYFGYVGLVKELISRIKKRNKSKPYDCHRWFGRLDT